ncbi:MAG: hypothetical protein GF388_08360, partial [Candidatus Aegiribacteria sp.]|nr:hypothetical protein [Candidatus Aegiribacteria sp.]MBD3295098.1 hypothetical protein [Candidatus Fermentibacteria bacterium]
MKGSLISMTRRTWLQVGRVIVFGLFVVFGIIFLGWPRVGLIYSGVAGIVLISVLLDFYFRNYRTPRKWQIWLYFVLDSVLLSTLIRMAGGFDGPFTAIFFVHTFMAGFYLGISGGVAIAVIDSLMLAVLAYATLSGFLSTSPTGSSIEKILRVVPSDVSFQYSLLFVMIYAGFLTITGLVSGYLSQHLLQEKGRAEGILRQLREARTISREILDSLSDGVLVIDNDGQPLNINRAGMRILQLGGQWEKSVQDTDIYTMLREYQLSTDMPQVIELSMEDRILECRMGTF